MRSPRPIVADLSPMPYRLGPRRYQKAGGCLVRVREDARKCSVFLGFADPADPFALKPIEGTGFFVGHGGQAYLVTAGHVAKTLSGGPFALRLTDDRGAGRVMEIEKPDWHFHNDPAVDVAVLLLDPPAWTTGTRALPSNEFVDDRRLSDWEIGPGDAVYLVGLFPLHPGKRGNLPVVHAGHIALMPSDEKIPVKKQGGRGTEEVDAYLVEAHALKGASGSPVMVRPTIRTMLISEADKEESAAIVEARDFLLGIWVAAWPGKPTKALSKALGISADAWLPVGMGLVIPAQRIMDILRRDDVIAERREMAEQDKLKRAATPTSAGASEPGRSATEANPSHREAFNSLVDAAAKKRPQGD